MKNVPRVIPFVVVLSLALGGCGEAGPASTAATDPAAVAAPVFPAEVLAMIDEYEQLATDLSGSIGDAAAHDASRDKLDRLMALSEAITPAFIARHPGCRAYLEASLGILAQWRSLDPEIIERDYHQDAALPKDGTPPACYHMKDLIVHPATAAALLSTDNPDRAQAKKEIDEVLAHVTVVRAG